MVIAHNLTAMNAQRQFKISQKSIKSSAEKLSSGFKINRAADDAAGLSISEKLRFQIRGLEQGANNIQEGIGYCQVADGALNEIQDMLHRMTELSVKAANGTNSDSDRKAIMDEIDQIREEMDRICTTTKYNEQYIFKDDEKFDKLPPYDVSFSGVLKDIYIYNESYTPDDPSTLDVDETSVEYGGVAYEGKRYAWKSIDSNMYDAATNTFKKGTYTLTADDGSFITLVCEDGSKPPQVSREFTTTAGEEGIYINKELIKWNQVVDNQGKAFDKNNVKEGRYSFNYGGSTGTFTVEAGENFGDVIQRLSNITFTSTYNLPTEEQAVNADFSKTQSAVTSTDEVKAYLENGTLPQHTYTLKAEDAGLTLLDDQNQQVGALLRWEDIIITDRNDKSEVVGITNWGDQSEDIWSDKVYTCTFEQTDSTTISFSFELINETSMDSVKQALDRVVINSAGMLEHENHVEAVASSSNVVSIEVIDRTNITLEEEYELGRDYSVGADEFGVTTGSDDGILKYDGSVFTVSFTGTEVIGDPATNTTTDKNYSSRVSATGEIKEHIKNQITADAEEYLELIADRYRAGVTDVLDISLTSIIGRDAITGNGKNTYLEESLDFKQIDQVQGALLSTMPISGEQSFAGAKIDFAGLGTEYELVELIGTGFNSTCQTCDNHYSVQFTASNDVDASWKQMTVHDPNGNTYNYNYKKEGKDGNYTLYIDVESMQGGVSDGVDFTNTLVRIFAASDFDFHFSQYATYSNGTELYVFDDRPEYVNENGESTATSAFFSPYAYEIDSLADFEITLYDQDPNSTGESITMKYQYDFKDLFSPDNLKIEYEESQTGKYVFDAVNNTYEIYDPVNNPAHIGQTRYTVKDVKFEAADFDSFVESYIENIVFDDIAKTAAGSDDDKTDVKLVGDYVRYRLAGDEKPNNAMVTTFTPPNQVYPKKETSGDVSLKIQCSSNTKDQLMIQKQKLSVGRMGLHRLDLSTADAATRSISLVDKATEMVSRIRSTFGAYQNRLEHSYAINQNVMENTTAAESRIRDVDMAKEMMSYAKENILQQSGQAILAQANSSTQGILSLLQ